MVEYENMRCVICDMKMNVDDLLWDDEGWLRAQPYVICTTCYLKIGKSIVECITGNDY